MLSGKSVAFHTLGCKLNFSESSTLSRTLEGHGMVKKSFDEESDVYVINTCSVTQNADKECRQIIRRIQKKAPGSSIVITGCYAQLKPKEIAEIPGVDLVLGAAEKFELPLHLERLMKGSYTKVHACEIEETKGFHATYSHGDRTRTFLKVQDGCDYQCSFCTIPLARGHSRSDTVDGVLANVRELVDKGTREIVLTGINLGDFGKGNEGGKKRQENFLDLVVALDEIEGIERFRISSIEPNLLSDEIIDFVAQSRRFMPHFHIPLQSGSDTLLGRMRRRYRTDLYADRVQKIKSLMPHGAIGVDVIVGFPTEDDHHFNETLEFLIDLDVTYLHVFTYSERADTDALQLSPAVPMKTRQERNRILRQLSYKKQMQFRKEHQGQYRKVLFESTQKGNWMEGYTDNYIKVQAPFDPGLVNQIVEWEIR